MVEYRRVIAKRFFDKRVVAWNTVSLLQHSARLRQLIRRIEVDTRRFYWRRRTAIGLFEAAAGRGSR